MNQKPEHEGQITSKVINGKSNAHKSKNNTSKVRLRIELENMAWKRRNEEEETEI